MVGSVALLVVPPPARHGLVPQILVRAASNALRFRLVEDVDRAIVRLLSEDGRRSFTDLSKETGLSVSAVHQRVRRLEQRGVIRGYRAIGDPVALGVSGTRLLCI